MQTQTFIDQEAGRITYKDMRAYECNDAPGEYVPSVTTILDLAPKGQGFYEFLKNRGKEADTIAMEAMEKGRRVHAATELYDRDKEYKIENPQEWTVEEVEMLYRYKDFSDRYIRAEPIIEQAYASLELGYGGTLDRIVIHEGKRLLLDIKTGGIYPYYWRQLAAYKTLWEQFNPSMPIDAYGIIHLKAMTRTDKDWQGRGWQVLWPEETHDYYMQLFLNTKKEHEIMHPDFKARNRIFDLTLKKPKP